MGGAEGLASGSKGGFRVSTTTVESLRAKMRAERDPKVKYGIAKEIIELRRKAEESGEAPPAPVARATPKQDPVAAYLEAKKRLAAKGATPSPSTSPPARKYSQGVRDWGTVPPAHLRQAVADARKFDLDHGGGIQSMPAE